MSERDYWTRMRRRRLSRRSLLGASARAGVGAAGLALVGCGDDDDTAQMVADVLTDEPEPETPPAMDDMGGMDDEPVDEPVDEELPEEMPVVSNAPTPGGVIRGTFVGLSSGNPPTLDPYENLTFTAQIPAGYHYSKLLRYVRGGPGVDPLNFAEVEADGAKLPEIVDDTTLLFEMQDNFRFHNVAPVDGRDVTVDDVLYSEQRFRDMSPNANSWADVVDRLEAVDERTFRAVLSKPFAPFFNLLGSPEHIRIQPREIVEDGTVAERPVGSGPWIFERFEPDVELVWRRNDDWWEQPYPLLDGVQAAIISDPSTIIANLGAGEFDFSLLDPAVYDAAVQGAPELEFTFLGSNVFGGMYFNFSIEPWNDVRVRQAWSLAQDRAGIVDVIDQTGQGGGWFSAIPQLAPFWLDPQDKEKFGRNVEYFHRDLQRANELMDAAGYPEGLDVVINNTLFYGAAYNQRFELHAATAEEGPFRTQFSSKEYAAYIATTFIGDFDEGIAIGPLKVNVEPDDVFFTNYHPNSGRHNYGPGPDDISTDTDLLAKFDAQRVELNLDARIELINEIQRDMAEKMYIVPWVVGTGVFGSLPHVEDLGYKSSFAVGTESLPYAWFSNV